MDLSALCQEDSGQILALASSFVLVGLGCLPLWLLPLQNRLDQDGRLLRALLCLAVGSLLADVFLHILPEASVRVSQRHHHHHFHSYHGNVDATTEWLPHDVALGAWTLLGILLFFIIEKIGRGAEAWQESLDAQTREGSERPQKIAAVGYLTMLANLLDNFTHGLAVAASFSISSKVGLTTTAAIAIHELPHEVGGLQICVDIVGGRLSILNPVRTCPSSSSRPPDYTLQVGDFAILIQSGLNKRQAILAQCATSLAAPVGTLVGLALEGALEKSNWLLPLTAGCFIYVAMTSLLPTILQPKVGMSVFLELFMISVGTLLVAVLVD
eukprot:m.269927 g.269927  ORF g.269927 m.269927 type:complete len:327 (-) comp54751_c0_seq1:112-1092(-)